MKHLIDYKLYENESVYSNSQHNLDIWKELMGKYDLQYFRDFQKLSKSDLEQIREECKSMRRYALNILNKELNKQGKSGQLLSIDVSDEDLYPYLKNDKEKFFKYSRILDFSDGYMYDELIKEYGEEYSQEIRQAINDFYYT